MRCPYCNNSDTRVTDSRNVETGIRRRRECTMCGLRVTTYERVQTRVVMLVKRDGRREEFHRDKLWASVTKACAKRPLQMGSIDKLVQDIEATLVDSGRAEMPSETIGEMVMERLKKLDRVAYIRYASVYRDFKDIETFKEEIESLLEPPQTADDVSSQLSFLEEQVLPARRRRRGRPQKASLPGSP